MRHFVLFAGRPRNSPFAVLRQIIAAALQVIRCENYPPGPRNNAAFLKSAALHLTASVWDANLFAPEITLIDKVD